jgi:hypothetical protein
MAMPDKRCRVEFEHLADGTLAFSAEAIGGLAMFRDHRDGKAKPVMALNADGLRRLQANLPALIEAVAERWSFGHG